MSTYYVPDPVVSTISILSFNPHNHSLELTMIIPAVQRERVKKGNNLIRVSKDRRKREETMRKTNELKKLK